MGSRSRSAPFSFALIFAKIFIICGSLLELCAFYRVQKLKYWKPSFWKFSDIPIISKIPALANGDRELFAELLRFFIKLTFVICHIYGRLYSWCRAMSPHCCKRISVTVNSLATDCGYTSWDSPFLYFGKLSGIH